MAVLATVSAAAVALSAIITRIMAIPQVNAWLAKVGARHAQEQKA